MKAKKRAKIEIIDLNLPEFRSIFDQLKED